MRGRIARVPQIPPHVTLTGKYVTLEPLTSDNITELHAAIGRPETFAAGWGGGPAAYVADKDEFTTFVGRYVAATNLPYLVRINQDGQPGRCVGMTCVGEFEAGKERCHLGWTAYAPEVQGTAINPETKLLVLGHLFDHGWGRVRIQADSINARSRAAIAKLGATFEGIVRRDQLRADGTWRDAAVFSVIIDDWPLVKSGLVQRLEEWSSAQRPNTAG